MKRKLFKSILTASAVAMICACGDDSSASSNPVNPITDSACAKVVVTADNAWVFNTGAADVVIYADGNVTDAAGQPFGHFDSATGVVMDLNGAPIATGVDVAALTACAANATVDPNTGAIEKFSSSSEAGNAADPTSSADGNNQNPGDPTSSAGVNPGDPSNPTSSAGGTEPTSSTGAEPVVSSSSAAPVKPVSGVADPSGYPVASYKNLLAAGEQKRGWNSRYWDACRPHCAQIKAGVTDTSSQAAYEAAGTVVRTCNVHDVEIPSFTIDKASLTNPSWTGWKVVGNSCNYQDAGEGIASAEDGGFACTDMIPVAVNDTLSYAFVAGPTGQGCGKCYHLQYDGHFNDEGDYNKPKATHQALKGKHIIAMASNIGHDVSAGSTQFDLMVPGGGVGQFDALTAQTGIDMRGFTSYGGFLSDCQKDPSIGYDGTLEQYQTCVKKFCAESFAKFPNLLQGCNWFADWFMAADNPSFVWEEVECPQYLVDKYKTNYNLTRRNDFAPHDSWADYTGTSPDDLEKAGKYSGDGTN